MDLAIVLPGTAAAVCSLASENLAVNPAANLADIVTHLGRSRPSLTTILRKTLDGGAPAPNRNLPWT